MHEPTRKSSVGEADAPPKKTSIAAPGGLSTLTNTTGGGDNAAPASKFLYMSGKHVHEPVRKGSVGGSDKGGEGSPTSGSAMSGSAAGRRKVRTSVRDCPGADVLVPCVPSGTLAGAVVRQQPLGAGVAFPLLRRTGLCSVALD